MLHIYRQIAIGGVAVSAALLGAGGAGAFQPATSNATSNQTAETMVGAMPTDDRSFVDLAASSDMFEIAASKLAKERGVGGEVPDAGAGQGQGDRLIHPLLRGRGRVAQW